MGKNLIQQRRGRGTMTFRSPGHNFVGAARHISYVKDTTIGEIRDIVHCAGHNSPLAKISYENGEKVLMIAPEGIRVGEAVAAGDNVDVKTGNTLPLQNIPEGTLIYNIEACPGDGGKFVRSSGTFAKVLSKLKGKVIVQLPSKKEREFDQLCRAMIGITAGGGRKEKPILKAGNHYHAMRARNKLYPHVCGQSMNAVDHPHGGSKSSKKNTPSSYSVSRNAPPGRKVGMIAPRRTGRKKR